MTMTLWHCRDSRSLRVLWTLEELGLDHELKTLPFPPRVRQKDYLTVNPLGTVPCLIDGGLRMTESAAICQYLAEKHGPASLAVARDEPDYAAWLNWLHFADATLTFPLAVVLRYSLIEPPERRLPQAAEDYRQFALGRLRIVESTLAEREYLCAERFTVADICVGYALHLARLLGIEEAFTPNAAAWWERLSARPAYRRAVER